MHSELNRRKQRTERADERVREGKGPSVSVPSINEPRFISEAYFLDFKFEPGSYYLSGKESLDGREVLKIDYLPSGLFLNFAVDLNVARSLDDKRTKVHFGTGFTF